MVRPIPRPASVSTGSGELDWIERLLAPPPNSQDDLKALSERIEAVLEEARLIAEAAAREADANRQLLSTLGPRPAEDAPLEAPEVHERRLELEEAVADQEGLRKELWSKVVDGAGGEGRRILVDEQSPLH